MLMLRRSLCELSVRMLLPGFLGLYTLERVVFLPRYKLAENL